MATNDTIKCHRTKFTITGKQYGQSTSTNSNNANNTWSTIIWYITNVYCPIATASSANIFYSSTSIFSRVTT